jgi:hypothetical protein
MPSPYLSKSRYLASLQCDRRLWLAANTPEIATPPSDGQQHIFQTGSEVGLAAHALFPGGVLVEEKPSDHAAAVERTESLMEDRSIPAIFEAAFVHDGVRIRVDILERLDPEPSSKRWGLREVKSAGKVKRPRHLPDLAVQKWVLEGNGLEVASAELIHINSDFVRGADAAEFDWSEFFERVELVGELDAAEMDGVGTRISSMHAIVESAAAPEREPGTFCKTPHLCNYWETCTAEKSATWFVQQTGSNAKRKARMVEVTESGEPWFSGELGKALAIAAPPLWALDFEAIGAAIPLFPGTNPFQSVTFQYSLDRLSADGDVEHFEHLASGREDPREGVARALVEVLRWDEAPVLAYGTYEKQCLRDMARHTPELAEELEAIVTRLVDLLPIVRAHVYHPDLLGSFSIKRVAPAFAPGVGYSDLSGVADGMAALGAFAEIVKGALSSADEARLRAELLEYCGRDTEALLEVYRALARAGA